MKTRSSRILCLIVLIVLGLSQIMCGSSDNTSENIKNAEETVKALENMEHSVFELKSEVETNDCEDYSPPANAFESWQFQEDKLVIIPGTEAYSSEYRIYKWQRWAHSPYYAYCRTLPGNYRECITDITNTSYSIHVDRQNPDMDCGQVKQTIINKNGFLDEEQAEAPQPEAPPVEEAGSPGEETADEPPAVEEETGTTASTVLGDWYGPACEEMEGTFPHEWSVNLMQNPATGEVAGTIKFHNCPGGGRVLYRVGGAPGEDGLLFLGGTKKSGGGTLYDDSPDARTFTFDPASGSFTE